MMIILVDNRVLVVYQWLVIFSKDYIIIKNDKSNIVV